MHRNFTKHSSLQHSSCQDLNLVEKMASTISVFYNVLNFWVWLTCSLTTACCWTSLLTCCWVFNISLTVSYYTWSTSWCILRLTTWYTTNYIITLATNYITKHSTTLSLRPLPLAPSVQADEAPPAAARSRPASPVAEPQQQDEDDAPAVPEAPPAAAAAPSRPASPAPEPQQQQAEIEGLEAPPAAAAAPSRPASPAAEPQQQQQAVIDAPAEAAAVCYVSVEHKPKHHIYVEPKTPEEWAARWQEQERMMKHFNNSMRLAGYKW
jgi:hypothetical protein